MGISRAALYSALGIEISIVEPMLIAAYEREAQREWRGGDGDSPHGNKWSTSFHSSSFPGEDPVACGRAAVYGLMDLPNEKPREPKLQAMFDLGSNLEHDWVRRFAAEGVLLSKSPAVGDDYQTVFLDHEHWLSGAADAIILPYGWTQSFNVEIKTTCLSGDTLVAVADGRNAVSLRQLADEGADVDVYASDGARTVIRKMRNIQVTRRGAQMVRVDLDDGSYVRCTPDHQFMLRDGSYKVAELLTPEDSLMRFDSRVFPVDSTMRRSIWQGPYGAGMRWDWQYKLIGRQRFGTDYAKGTGLMIHHANFDSLDDRPDNFELLTQAEHMRLHNTPERRARIGEASRNAWAALTTEERSVRGRKIAASRDQEATNQKIREALAALGPEWRHARSVKAHANRTANQRRATSLKAWDSQRLRDSSVEIPSALAIRELRKSLQMTQGQFAFLLCVHTGTVGRWERDEFPPTGSARVRLATAFEQLAPANHRVVSVNLDGVEDTYCGTVEDVGNFAVITSGTDSRIGDLSGVVVKNSIEKVEAMLENREATPYSHSKYLRQLKTYISLANEQNFSPEVVLCVDAWAVTKEFPLGLHWCPVHQSFDCETRAIKLAPPDAGELIYSSREEPLKTVSYYVSLDTEHMRVGREKLAEWQDYFLRGELPPHPREKESKKWSVPPCQYCGFKKGCKVDLAEKRSLAESNAIERALEIRPQYDYEEARVAVLDRWKIEDPLKAKVAA